MEVSLTPTQRMERMDEVLSHVWMVRTFLKHCDEAEEDEELCEVHRGLYDFMLALGPALADGDAERYLKMAAKKLTRFRKACELFFEIQPDVSGHMNFRMAARSLRVALDEIERLMQS